MLNITFIDIFFITISFVLGVIFANYLEKKVWPNFNKKYGLGEFAEDNKKDNEENDENIEEKKE